ncbi:MAG: FAD-dependent oxidoreductase, partial [Candidatus Bathyarchaeia archaeon]
MNFDLTIIGGGSAGFSAAIKADELQADTLLINDDAVGLGGTCVNAGCLPTKHLLHVGAIIHNARRTGSRGLHASVSFDFKEITKGKDEVVGKLRRIKYEEVLKGLSRVEYVEGSAKLLSEKRVRVNGETYGTDRVIVATGSSTFIPPVKGINDVNYLTNKEALKLEDKPDSIIILGGGPLGVEFAQMFSRFGIKIYLFQQAERIVIREEPELTGLLQRYLMEEGIEIYTKVEVKEAEERGERKIVKAVIDGKLEIFEGDQLLLATGRRANTLN